MLGTMLVLVLVASRDDPTTHIISPAMLHCDLELLPCLGNEARSLAQQHASRSPIDYHPKTVDERKKFSKQWVPFEKSTNAHLREERTKRMQS
jgi:hypothetical protein